VGAGGRLVEITGHTHERNRSAIKERREEVDSFGVGPTYLVEGKRPRQMKVNSAKKLGKS